MGDPITIISGFGRCGSSLVMQMFHAGGAEVSGYWPCFEDARTRWLPDRHDWVNEYEGKVLKILDPVDCKLPLGPKYRVIWLDRDPKQQAKSFVNVQRNAMNLPATRKDVPKQSKYIRQKRGAALNELDKLGPGRFAITSYEGILLNPEAAATSFNQFFGGGLDIDKMASMVEKRTPDFRSSRGLQERERYMRGGKFNFVDSETGKHLGRWAPPWPIKDGEWVKFSGLPVYRVLRTRGGTIFCESKTEREKNGSTPAQK